jgi:hypothetical protein
MMWITGKTEQIPKIGSGKKFWRNILFFKLSHNRVRYGRCVSREVLVIPMSEALWAADNYLDVAYVTVLPFFLQVMWGVGSPVAIHVKATIPPAFTF